MTTYFDTSLSAKTALRVSACFGVRAARVGSPEAIAMAGGAAISHDVRMTDGNLHALAARCAG
jgi:hypothetical protein